MSKINILIVEDEAIVAKDIQMSLKKSGYNIVDVVSNGEAAIKSLESLVPDLVMLDIMLKGNMSGVDVSEHIKNRFNIPVIFLTAYADQSTIDKAKQTGPYGYIIKPFKDIDLHTTIEMALHKHKKLVEIERERNVLSDLIVQTRDGRTDQSLFIKHNSRLIKVKSDEIYFIEALKDYVVINTIDKKFTLHMTMKDVESRLSPLEFFRVHRSFIVRLDKILAVEGGSILFNNELKHVPIGGSFKEGFFSKIDPF